MLYTWPLKLNKTAADDRVAGDRSGAIERVGAAGLDVSVADRARPGERRGIGLTPVQESGGGKDDSAAVGEPAGQRRQRYAVGQYAAFADHEAGHGLVLAVHVECAAVIHGNKGAIGNDVRSAQHQSAAVDGRGS